MSPVNEAPHGSVPVVPTLGEEQKPILPLRDAFKLVGAAVAGMGASEVAHRLAGDQEKIRLTQQLIEARAKLTQTEAQVATLGGSLKDVQFTLDLIEGFEQNGITEQRENSERKRVLLLEQWEPTLKRIVLESGREWQSFKRPDGLVGTYARVRVSDVIQALQEAFPWENAKRDEMTQVIKTMVRSQVMKGQGGNSSDANEQVIDQMAVLAPIEAGQGGILGHLDNIVDSISTGNSDTLLERYSGLLHMQLFPVNTPGIDIPDGSKSESVNHAQIIHIPVVGSILWDKPKADTKLTDGRLVVISPMPVPNEVKQITESKV